MQRFKSKDTFVYAQSYVFKKLLENIFKNSSGGLLEMFTNIMWIIKNDWISVWMAPMFE